MMPAPPYPTTGRCCGVWEWAPPAPLSPGLITVSMDPRMPASG